MRKIFALHIIAYIGIFACASTQTPIQESKTVATDMMADKGVKNIILLIGDGMGLTQMTAGTYSNNNTSHFERCEYIGLHKSHSGDKLITDSASGATAFACGQKTYNGAIAVDMDTVSLPTILEEAEQKGLATGLIATSSIVHATPASFIAHNKYRKNYDEIAADFLNTEIDFFLGGGKQYFDNREIDERNLIAELETKGYQIGNYFDHELENIKVDPNKNFGFLTSNSEPLPFAQGREYLSTAVDMGIKHLSHRGEDGFFLMIEGSQIDWGGHANEFDYVLSEWMEFNTVVGQVLDWAEKDGETLVIITADHETGGLAIQNDSTMGNIVAAFTSDYHTGTMIPVYSHGPGAEGFKGIYENTAIYNKMRAAFGWE